LIDLGFTTGDPWLVRRSLGSGWVAALLSAPQSGTQTGSSSEEAWNAMATWPSFVPIMQKIMETIIGGAEQAMNLSVGEPLVGSIARQARPAGLTIRRPDNSINRLTIPPASEGNRQPWVYPATDLAGIYHVAVSDGAEADDQSDVARPYAVNIVPSQSDLQSISVSALPLSNDSSPAQPRPSVIRSGESMATTEWISRWCLIGLLVVLSCESFLAWNLGRRLT
jgi:hypothetical protein